MILEFVVTGDGKQRNRATRLCYQSRLFKTDCFDPRALLMLQITESIEVYKDTKVLTLVPCRVWETLDHTVRSESLLFYLYIKQDLLPVEKGYDLTHKHLGVSHYGCFWKHLLRRVIVC